MPFFYKITKFNLMTKIFILNLFQPCDVCGDKAKAQNYGGISCNCCRSFFHYYTLHKVKDPMSFQHLRSNCKFEQNCEIDKVTRRKCKTCRFFKCVQIGMSPAWAISEHEKTKQVKQQKTKGSNITTNVIVDQMSDVDVERVENLSKIYKNACELIPYSFLTRANNEILSKTKVITMSIGIMSTSIRRWLIKIQV